MLEPRAIVVTGSPAFAGDDACILGNAIPQSRAMTVFRVASKSANQACLAPALRSP
jgi:hypothetical protein